MKLRFKYTGSGASVGHSYYWSRREFVVIVFALVLFRCPLSASNPPANAAFKRDIEPVLQEFCHDCHADGANKGGVAFDEPASGVPILEDRDLWWKVLRNLRGGIMPPPNKPRPSLAQRELIERWIKTEVFELDPLHPDPGRVTVRRLNRVEYRNTIRDLLGVDFNTETEFPPDDAGHGFDNIGEVLTLPPMLLEKYLAAARTVVSRAVPSVSRVPAERQIPGSAFGDGGPGASDGRRTGAGTSRSLSYYEPATVSADFSAADSGRYEIAVKFTANERYVDNQFDYNKCRLVFKVDGEELFSQEYAREGGRSFQHEFERQWSPGNHSFTFELVPLTPSQAQVRSLTLRLDSVVVRGPMEESHWVPPANYARFFPKPVPEDTAARRDYARILLGDFARKAFRRPVDGRTVDRLVEVAETASGPGGGTFESGIGQAMVAVLASPRFLFREEGIVETPSPASSSHPFVDEYALASRLSYFLWSSMPDDELMRLAEEKRLRKELQPQVARMLADARSEALMKNFIGQWLQARDIETVSIDARQVLARETAPDPELDRQRQRFRALRDKPEATLTEEEKAELAELRTAFFRRFGRPPRAELTGDLRRAMRQETEMTFEHVLRANRSLLELIDSGYTFLNERLARHYGLTNLNVTGESMQRVDLPEDSPRGGILTQGTVLTVTSNPTRTSPVKRGLFILENILGTPPPPPPPDITPLEDAAKGIEGRTVSLREMLALHREQPQCSSCHNRMDPLGLALEHFNALGMWRDQERGDPIDATGRLMSGESFTSIQELKAILVRDHAEEFYRTLTEKLMTYALGRGLDYHDVDTVDGIVARLQQNQGRPDVLLSGIIESAPFQRTRSSQSLESSTRYDPGSARADARILP